MELNLKVVTLESLIETNVNAEALLLKAGESVVLTEKRTGSVRVCNGAKLRILSNAQLNGWVFVDESGSLENQGLIVGGVWAQQASRRDSWGKVIADRTNMPPNIKPFLDSI